MADLKTQLEIGVDASSVDASIQKAKISLADLGAAAEAAGNRGGDSFELLARSADDAAQKANSATRRLIADAQRSFAALQAGGAPGPRNTGAFLETRATQLGADSEIIKRYAAALDDVVFAKNRAAQASLGLGKSFDYTALSAKQTTAALRQVPAQLTDIFVSLQGGQAPLTVLLQQGGQLKDVFGGIGPAARALGGYVASLINPFTLAAAAAAALAVAYNQGSKEADAYAKALILTGNAAGSTVSQLNAMAVAVSDVVGTQSQAADAVAQFAVNGNIAAASIERFARVAVQLERTAGQAVGETVKQFSELGKEPLAASIKLNETTRFLTESLYRQIKALDDQGRTAEAAALAQRGFADAMESRTGQLEVRLGSIERAWRAVKDASAEAWSAMLNVGRADTLDVQLERAMARLKELDAGARSVGGRSLPTTSGEVDAARREVEALNRRIFLEGELAERQAESAKQIAARAEADKDGLKYQSESAKLAREIVRQANVLRAAGADPKEIADRIAAIKAASEKSAPKAPRGPRDQQRGIDRSDLGFDLSQIKSQADELVRIYSDAERILEALRSGGLVNEKGYYESRRQFLELETQAKEDALRKEIQRLNQEQALIDARKVRRDDPADEAQKARDAIDNARKIAEAESRLATLRASSSSRAVIFQLEEARAIKEKSDALISARQAAEAYFESQNRQQNRSLESFSQGPREQAFTQGVNQIDDNFAQQERELQNLKVLGKLTQEEYDARLAIIREFQAKSIQSFTAYYNRLIELQGSAALGAQQAVKTYIDEAANVAQSTNELVSNTLRGLEDSLTRFLTTGKGGFKEFANAIVADITRIIVKQQIANALAGQMGTSIGGSDAFGKFFGALLGSSTGSSVAMSSGQFGIGVAGFAMGGAVERGRLVEVNEGDGPGELFNVGNRQYLLASQSGQVSPQKASSSPNQQAMTVINNFTLAGSVDRRTESQIAAAAGRGVRTAMARNT